MPLAVASSGSASDVAGDLDPGFGTAGIVDVPPGDGTYLSILVQPDGKILAGGHTAPGLFFASVVRLNPDGILDQSFGNGGVATWDFEPDRPDSSGLVFTLELLPDGKILAGGSTGAGFALARLNSDGTLDSTFSGDGVSTPELGEGAIFDVAVQSDGSVLAAGRAGPLFGFPAGNQLGLARFLANGDLDPAFGTGGFTTASFAEGYLSTALVRPDGSVLAGGSTAGFADFQLARYGPGGIVDTSFGVGGFATTDFSPSDVIDGLAVQPDGRIVAAGASINRGDDFALARYTPEGTLDPSFGQGGKVETELMPFDQALASDVALQPDGRIVAAGCSRNCDRLALARYMFDGSLDPTFGNAGVSVSETVEDTSAIALQPDGKIIASAGGHFLSSPLGTTLVRVLGQAPPAEPFSSLDTKLHSDKARADFDGTFRLGEANDGIDPATERVAVTLGSFEIVIPAGSFVLDSHHRWSFNGEVGTTRIEMTIQPEQATSKTGLYDFDYRATGPDVPRLEGFVDVALEIGNDIGHDRIRAR